VTQPLRKTIAKKVFRIDREGERIFRPCSHDSIAIFASFLQFLRISDGKSRRTGRLETTFFAENQGHEECSAAPPDFGEMCVSVKRSGVVGSAGFVYLGGSVLGVFD
jgi:hypothetical protein